MKRTLRVLSPTLNRRQFLIGAAAIGVAACGTAPTETDAGNNSNEDAGDSNDAGTNPICSGSAIATQMPSDFTMDTPVYVARANAFIVRDSGGLFAVSSICTHQGCVLTAQSSDLYCDCHGSEFSFDGSVIRGPARRSLAHYALCITENGVVGIDTHTTVSASTRLNV